jgi:hypothetical protein
LSGDVVVGSLGWRFPRLSGPLAVVAIGAALAMTVPGIASRLATTTSSTPAPSPAAAPEKAANPVSADLPLSFEANAGQTDAQVKFLARTRDYSLFLTSDKAVLSLAGNGTDKAPTAVYTSLLGSNPAAKVTGVSALPGTVNYLNSPDPAQRHAGVPTFARVAYAGVYPGVDLAYYGKASSLEYDFTVAPHADPSQIRMGIEGADSLRLDDAGNLVIATAAGEITQHAPVLYQVVGGTHRPVQGSFTLTDNQVGFSVGAYDTSKPLVIDPTLAYSTFLDGKGEELKVDTTGNAYVAGETTDIAFPTTPGAAQRSFSNDFGCEDSFVTKLNPSGSSVIYSTFIATTCGGGLHLALAPDGSTWVAGTSNFLTDVPVTPGAFQTDKLQDPDPFLVKLSPDGSSVLYGTYFTDPFGGSLFVEGIASDPSGDIWMTESTSTLPVDPPFPTSAGAAKASCNPSGGGDGTCASDMLLVRVHPVGEGAADLAYATFLGGANIHGTPTVAPDGSLYVSGTVFQGLETTPNALNPAPLGGPDAYLIRVRPVGSGNSDLVYSSYLGGSSGDGTARTALAPDGTIDVSFSTDSADVAITPGAFEPFPRDLFNAVLERIDTSRPGPAGLLYSTYIGGDGIDEVNGIAVDGRGHVFLAGRASFDFPVRNPLACCPFNKGPANPGDGTNQGDAYVLEMNPAGHGDADLVFSTFLGGSTNQESAFGLDLAVDSAGRGRIAWVSGNRPSDDFPVTSGAYKTTLGSSESWLVKIDFSDEIPCTRTLTGNLAGPIVANFGEVVCLNNASVTNGVLVTGGGEARIQNSRIVGSVTSAAAAAFTMCGSTVAGNVLVAGTSPSFVTTNGPGCGANTITGSSNVPGGGPPGSTTTTTPATTTSVPAATTTTVPATTTTIPATTTTTAASGACASLRAQRQAFNAAIDAAERGQSPATVALLEQQRSAQNAVIDHQLATC